jgi:hypothetical protein
MTPTLRFRIIYERNALVSMEMSFFALPSKQGPAQGRFKPTHDSAELVAGRSISLSTKVAACVRLFETPTALNHGRTESKKDISILFSPVSFLGEVLKLNLNTYQVPSDDAVEGTYLFPS